VGLRRIPHPARLGETLAPYRQPKTSRSSFEMAVTFGPLPSHLVAGLGRCHAHGLLVWRRC